MAPAETVTDAAVGGVVVVVGGAAAAVTADVVTGDAVTGDPTSDKTPHQPAARLPGINNVHRAVATTNALAPAPTSRAGAAGAAAVDETTAGPTAVAVGGGVTTLEPTAAETGPTIKPRAVAVGAAASRRTIRFGSSEPPSRAGALAAVQDRAASTSTRGYPKSKMSC